jgi:CHAT domain-containing protein
MELGRSAEAGEFLLKALALREASNRARSHIYTQGMLPLISLGLSLSEATEDYEKALIYVLTEILISKVDDPERSDSFRSEYAPVNLVKVLDLLRRLDRKEQMRGLLPFALEEAKRDIGLRNRPEPFALPLDLGVFEQTFGAVDRSETIASALALVGQIYSWMDRHDEALPLFEQIAKTRRNIYGEASPQASAALARVANEQLLTGSRDDALRTARTGYSWATKFTATRLAPEQAATAAPGVIRPAGFVLLDALYAQDQTNGPERERFAEEALGVAQTLQSTRAALALQALEMRLIQQDVAMRDFVRRRQDLKEQLARLDAALVSAVSKSGELDPEREAKIREVIANTERLLRSHEATRPAGFAELDELMQTPALTAPALRDHLETDEAILGFAIGDDHSFIFVATKDDLRWKRISLGADPIRRKVASLRNGLDPSNIGVRAPRAGISLAPETVNQTRVNLRAAYELYAALFHPIEAMISDKNHLLIVPSGPLTSLPFNALVSSPPDESLEGAQAYRKADWLIRRKTLSVLPSLAALKTVRMNARTSLADRPFVGFGDPRFGPCEPDERSIEEVAASPKGGETVAASLGGETALAAETVLVAAASETPASAPAIEQRGYASFFRGTQVDGAKLCNLAALPESADELKAVADSLGVPQSEVRIQEAATETAVKSEALDRYRIIQFATHGLVAGEISGLGEPGLVLTRPVEPSDTDDGLLTASEVAQLKLDADWVILSACNTAAGDRPGAEALSGLARAFFYAGARSLLVSHWPVNSAAAVKITTQTLKELTLDSHIGRAEALRRAMLALIDEGAPHETHPGYWAPFVLVGEGSARSTK